VGFPRQVVRLANGVVKQPVHSCQSSLHLDSCIEMQRRLTGNARATLTRLRRVAGPCQSSSPGPHRPPPAPHRAGSPQMLTTTAPGPQPARRRMWCRADCCFSGFGEERSRAVDLRRGRWPSWRLQPGSWRRCLPRGMATITTSSTSSQRVRGPRSVTSIRAHSCHCLRAPWIDCFRDHLLHCAFRRSLRWWWLSCSVPWRIDPWIRRGGDVGGVRTNRRVRPTRRSIFAPTTVPA
jgi:hypothetical protein